MAGSGGGGVVINAPHAHSPRTQNGCRALSTLETLTEPWAFVEIPHLPTRGIPEARPFPKSGMKTMYSFEI